MASEREYTCSKEDDVWPHLTFRFSKLRTFATTGLKSSIFKVHFSTKSRMRCRLIPT